MDLKTLHKISYGLYVICSKDGEKINGQIANALFQVTSKPPTIAVSINKQNLTHEYIEKSKCFTVSILSEDAPLPFIGNFGFKSGRDIDKFKETGFKKIPAKIVKPPIIDGSTVAYECKVENKVETGDHTLYIGKVVAIHGSPEKPNHLYSIHYRSLIDLAFR